MRLYGVRSRSGTPEDMAALEQCLSLDQRTYNSAQLTAKLEIERQVKLSADRMRRILQKRGSGGSGLVTRNTDSKTHQSKSSSNKLTSKP